MWEIWANQLLSKALSCLKSKKSSNLVTLDETET